jgi:hypothetical protein
MKDLVQVPDVMTLGTVFAKSGYFQDARDQAQGVVKILAGQELGFGPVASMTGIYIVKGKVSLSANLIAAAVKRGGKYNYRVMELSEKACKIDFYEGKEKIGESGFTMEDAKTAGLVNDNYKKFARNMLFARAMSNGAKWFCADVFGGPVYTPDELGALVDGETGEMTARPKDEVLPPPVAEPVAHAIPAPAEIIVLDDPTPDEAAQRTALIDKITARAAFLKMPTKDRKDYAAKYLNGAAMFTADLAALQDLLGALEYAR